MPPPGSSPREVIRFRKYTLAYLRSPHKETAKNYFQRALYAGAAYVLSRWCALAAAYMAAGAGYALTRLYIGRVICRAAYIGSGLYGEAAYTGNRLYGEPHRGSRLYSEPLIYRAGYIGRRLYG